MSITSWSEFDEWADFIVSPEGDSFAERIAALRPPWMAHAACRGADQALFFPDRHTASEAIPAAHGRSVRAVRCRRSASSTPSPNLFEPAIRGLWGGASERDRSHIRKHRRQSA